MITPNNVGKKCFVLGDRLGEDGKTQFGVRMEGIIVNEDAVAFWIKRCGLKVFYVAQQSIVPTAARR